MNTFDQQGNVSCNANNTQHDAKDAGGQVRGYGMGGATPAQSSTYPAAGYAAGNAAHPTPGLVSQGPVSPGQVPPPGYAAVMTVNGIQYVPTMKPKRSKAAKIGIAVAIVCALLAALIIYFMVTATPSKSSRQGSLGQLEGKTAEEIQAELDRVVEEGMFNISISSLVEFADGTSEGDLRIENVPGNHYLMRVFIIRDDNGEQIYETDLIEPNYHIQSDTLDVDLPAGTYPCTAVFYAYDPETEDEIGQAAAQITVHVLD